MASLKIKVILEFTEEVLWQRQLALTEKVSPRLPAEVRARGAMHTPPSG